MLPELRQLVVQCRAEKNFPDWAKKEKTAAVEEGIRAIEATTTQPELRSVQAAITGG